MPEFKDWLNIVSPFATNCCITIKGAPFAPKSTSLFIYAYWRTKYPTTLVESLTRLLFYISVFLVVATRT